jgi:hypothetical protein
MNKFDLTGYVSPIQRIVKEVQARIEEHEGQILMKAVHNVGFDVDKHELMKALAYDLEQYQKGYADAMKNAVPLDKLCLLLHDIAGCPCYSQQGADMCNRLIGDQCNTEWDDVECWKRFLTKWMEENDASISSR